MIEHLNKDDILIERYEEGRIHKPKPTKIEEHMADVTAGMNKRIGWPMFGPSLFEPRSESFEFMYSR